jgi:hypothetical protein
LLLLLLLLAPALGALPPPNELLHLLIPHQPAVHELRQAAVRLRLLLGPWKGEHI